MVSHTALLEMLVFPVFLQRIEECLHNVCMRNVKDVSEFACSISLPILCVAAPVSVLAMVVHQADRIKSDLDVCWDAEPSNSSLETFGWTFLWHFISSEANPILTELSCHRNSNNRQGCSLPQNPIMTSRAELRQNI